MSLAPPIFSSAGWPMSRTVPAHLLRFSESHRAVATRFVMWMSWPQACITPTGWPASSGAVALLANGRPVASVTGSASRSDRTRIVGPWPFLRTPTTPSLPTPVVTSAPAFFSSSANRAAVATSL